MGDAGEIPDDVIADDWVSRYRNPESRMGLEAMGEEAERALRDRRIVPSASQRLITITGPIAIADGEDEGMQSWGGVLAAQTISTYPMRQDGSNIRDGDPICDRYAAAVYKNRIRGEPRQRERSCRLTSTRQIIAVADGCNWGVAPMMAASRARDAVLEYLKEKDSRIRDVEEAALYLLRSFNYAHRKMSQRSRELENVGTSTLIACMVVEMEPDPSLPPDSPNWAFVCASVGDCKAFHIDARTRVVSDLTASNRVYQEHANDCGGRLGPTLADGGPDLRNLKTFFHPCREGDLLMAMSDGVHDNLHPRMLGIEPMHVGLTQSDWNDVDAATAEQVVVNFRTQFFSDNVLGPGELGPRDVVAAALRHAHATTKSSRDWMERNPGRRLPKDYKRFPGKMDHTTIVCCRVGYAEVLPGKSESQRVRTAERPRAGTKTGEHRKAASSEQSWARRSPDLAPVSTPEVTRTQEWKASEKGRVGQDAQKRQVVVQPGSERAQMMVGGGQAERNGTKSASSHDRSRSGGSSSSSGVGGRGGVGVNTNVPLAVTVTQRKDSIAIYCRATAKSKFECIAKPHEVVLVVTPSKLFVLGEDESVIGGIDELNQPYKRVIPLPDDVRIDIRSKKMSYNPDIGIITIVFKLQADTP